MIMKDNYFSKRAEQDFINAEKKADKLYKTIKKYYRKAMEEIEKNIAFLYAKFEKDNGITLEEAKKLLNIDEMIEWKRTLPEYLKLIEKMGDEKLLLELNTLAMQSRITRLEYLEKMVSIQNSKMRNNINDDFTEHLREVYKESYYRNFYNNWQGFDVNLRNMVYFDEKEMNNILKYNWQGSNYSKRLWDNTDKLNDLVKKSVINSLSVGKPFNTLVKELKIIYGKKYDYAIKRVINTETAYVHTLGERESYLDAEIEKYKILATLDNKTSDICIHQDGKIYNVEEMEIGVNAPPFHPNCRTITIPVTKYDVNTTRIARDENGKSVTVEDISYKEWKKKYVDNNLNKFDMKKNEQKKDYN